MTKWLAIPIAVLVGVLVGIIGGFVQAQRFQLGSIVIPWGAVLVMIVTVIVVRGGAWLAMSRWGGWATFLGWLGATILMSSELPDGSVALSGGGRQMFYLIAGVVLGAAMASLPVPLRGIGAREPATPSGE